MSDHDSTAVSRAKLLETTEAEIIHCDNILLRESLLLHYRELVELNVRLEIATDDLRAFRENNNGTE